MRIGDQLILLRKILSFAAIAKTGNVTAAALENGMKQSNLSGYVKELEEKVGAKLFEHGDRRMILTEVGKNLYEISCSIEKSVYKINSYKQQNNNVSGAVRLWTSDGLAAAYLSSCLPGFYQLYPDVKIEILCSIEAPSVLYDADLAVVYEKAGTSRRRYFCLSTICVSACLLPWIIWQVSVIRKILRTFRKTTVSAYGQIIAKYGENGAILLTTAVMWPRKRIRLQC